MREKLFLAAAFSVGALHLHAGTAAGGSSLSGCPLFPPDNIWNTPVHTLPAAARSSDYVRAIGYGDCLHPDFGSGTWEGRPIGIPFNIVDASQPRVSVAFDYADESDPGPYPIPPGALIEGGADADGDRHCLVLDRGRCILYELWDSHPLGDGSWRAGSGAVFDLASHALSPNGWTSADAAGLPILPGLVRYDEVAAGEITHAVRFTAPDTQRAYVWPARHHASDITDPSFPPMGQRFRLKADYDISPFPNEVQVILRGLKKYGMILADNGAPWFIGGAPDERWDNDRLSAIKAVPGSAFEAVECSGLMRDPDSGQVVRADEIRPSIRLNGSDGPVTVSSGDTVTLTVSLDAGGNSDEADWWLAIVAPSGAWHAYVHPVGWRGVGGAASLAPAHRGRLFDLPPFTALSASTAGASPGVYTIYFGVDLLSNGRVDPGMLRYAGLTCAVASP